MRKKIFTRNALQWRRIWKFKLNQVMKLWMHTLENSKAHIFLWNALINLNCHLSFSKLWYSLSPTALELKVVHYNPIICVCCNALESLYYAIAQKSCKNFNFISPQLANLFIKRQTLWEVRNRKIYWHAEHSCFCHDFRATALRCFLILIWEFMRLFIQTRQL